MHEHQIPAISSRKEQHVELCVQQEVQFRQKTNGLERYEFMHNALPELNFTQIRTDCHCLGYPIGAPLMISSMTGGYQGAEAINAGLAEIAAELNIPMGLGSQRQALENADFHQSFRIVRQKAPHILIFSNIGAAEIARKKDFSYLQRLIDIADSNALIIHLNPLQELMQPEGDTDFTGVLQGIELAIQQLHIPVIIKEVGAGISANVARTLLNIGVQGIDIAGAGGTSWAGVEILRHQQGQEDLQFFWDWGIPTAECIRQNQALKGEYAFTLIASGGIQSGPDIAKSIALGADLAASARPILSTYLKSGQQAAFGMLQQWLLDIRRILFLTGSKDISQLKRPDILRLIS
jgi:isopentenyl-diphosphate delta-isomerase